MTYITQLLSRLALALLPAAALAAPPDGEPLDPEKAFPVTARVAAGGVDLAFRIVEGYYLYGDRFRVEVDPALPVGAARIPKGVPKDDPFIGPHRDPEAFRHGPASLYRGGEARDLHREGDGAGLRGGEGLLRAVHAGGPGAGSGGAVNPKLIFAGVGVLALLAGTALWLGSRSSGSAALPVPADASPAVIYSAAFADPQGQSRSLGQFQGQVLVVNFWATWCAPCREEMPGFTRLQERWKGRGVQFVGLANDDRAKVDRFGRELGINYPLWTGSQEVMELSKRLGNRLGVLPHTVILDADGRVVESRIGVFHEAALETRLSALAPKSR